MKTTRIFPFLTLLFSFSGMAQTNLEKQGSLFDTTNHVKTLNGILANTDFQKLDLDQASKLLAGFKTDSLESLEWPSETVQVARIVETKILLTIVRSIPSRVNPKFDPEAVPQISIRAPGFPGSVDPKRINLDSVVESEISF